MVDLRHLAVHQLGGADDPAAEGLPEGLVAEADAEDGGPTGGFMGTGEKLVGGCYCLLCSGNNRALDWTGLAVAVALVCFVRYRRPPGR